MQSMKNQLRRLCSLFVCAALLFCVYTPVSAKEYAYTLSDLGMNISMPEEFVVLTRELPEDDGIFSLIGMDHETAMQMMQINNLYMDGVHGETGMQITIHMYENEQSQQVGNFKDISQDDQQLYMQNFLQTTAALGQMQQVGEFSTLQAGDALFYDGTFQVDAQGMTQNIRIFNTVKNNQNILITFYMNLQEFSQDDLQMMEQIINSISFSEIPVSQNSSSTSQISAASSQSSQPTGSFWQENGAWMIVVGVIVVMVAGAVILIVYQKRKEKS